MVLAGVTVVDLTRIVSGPFCTAILADLGAEVVKVESPGAGDVVREQGERVGGLSLYFANFNRGKKSITIDLHDEEGRAVLARLLATADVLVDNYRPDVLARMGFGPERLQEIRPGLVHCGINGFGTAGPYAERPAFDFVVQAMSGFMSLNGFPNGPPLRTGAPIGDLVAGLYAALGVVAALLRRERTGASEHVSVSMLSALVSLHGFHAANCLATGAEPVRTGNDHLLVAPYGLFATADGVVAIAPSHEAIYRRLVDVLDLGADLARPEYSTNAARLARRAEVHALVETRTRERPSAHWVERLNAAGVPCGPVHTLAQVFADPQVAAEQMVLDLPQPIGARVLGFPVKFRDAPCRLRRGAPGLGEHTDEVLDALGVNAAERARLRGRGVL